MVKVNIEKVSASVVRKRVNRALAHDGKKLRTERAHMTEPASIDCYAIVDHKRGIIARNVNLETLARELGVLQEYEMLEPD